MADKKITQLTNITGANLVDADEFVVVDISADETKAITLGELKEAFDSGSGFVRITGDTMTGDLGFGDNDKAIFGAGSDLQIYHSGTHSRIVDSGTGSLLLQGTNLELQNGAGTEVYLTAIENAEVSLRYNNSTKLATTSTGVDITGTLTSDGLLVEGEVAGQGASIEAHATVTEFGDALLIARSDNASNNLHAGVKVQGSNNPFYIYQTNGANTNKLRFNYNAMSDAGGQMTIDNNGDISFYEDTGTTPKFFWDASAEKLLIGDTSNSTASGLYIKTADPTDLFTGQLVLKGTALTGAADTGASIVFEGFNGSGNRTLGSIQSLKENSTVGDSLAYMRFSTFGSSGTQERMRIDSSGNVGIGTSSPSAKIDASGTYRMQLRTDDAVPELRSITTNGAAFKELGFNGLDLRFFTSSSERMRIDSSGRVGIGTSSPAANLEITDSIELPSVSLSSTGTDHMGLITGTVSSMMAATTGNNILFAHQPFANRGTFSNFTERMRIDSSGNLLVGKTTGGVATDGFQAYAAGYATITDTSFSPLILNRKTSDGSIVDLRKDGSTVGSIGSVDANSIRIGKGDGNLRFYDFGSAIAVIPCNSSGANQSNVVDLGNSSSTFKDLYLSGGVYLGGTGSANKLDDYETGTWTPTFAGLTIGNGTVSGTYTKVGRQVTVVFGFACGSTTSVGTLGNITGLPFASANIWSGYIKVHGVAFDTGSRWYEAVAVLGNNSNTIFVPSITNYNSAISASNPMTWANSDTLVFTATYFTT